jgi:hypothetical protein
MREREILIAEVVLHNIGPAKTKLANEQLKCYTARYEAGYPARAHTRFPAAARLDAMVRAPPR